MLAYCQLNSWEHISVKFESEFYHFHSRKFIWKCCLPKWQQFCPWGDGLTEWILVMHACISEWSNHQTLYWLTSKGMNRKKLQWYWVENRETAFQEYVMKILSAMSGLVCLGLNVLSSHDKIISLHWIGTVMVGCLYWFPAQAHDFKIRHSEPICPNGT